MRLPARLSLTAGVVAAVVGLGGCGSSTAPDTAPTPTVSQAPVQTYTDTGSGDVTATSAPLTKAQRALLARVHLAGVSIGAGGQYIAVRFRAPPRLADSWRSAVLSVTDERTHRVYDQIPTVPLIGTLLAPPHTEGQVGYVMFMNTPPLGAGARLTVVLGDFKQTHVAVTAGGDQ